MARYRVRRCEDIWEVWVYTEDTDMWQFSLALPAWWQAMLQVTGELPYGSETEWTPALRPMWVN